MKSYFDEVFEMLDKMTDDEFDDLLIKSGIDNCPFEELEAKSYRIQTVYKEIVNTRNIQANTYYSSSSSKTFLGSNFLTKKRINNYNNCYDGAA